jgi:hypothetical protein
VAKNTITSFTKVLNTPTLRYGGGNGVGRETIVHAVSDDLYNFTLLEDNATVVSPDGKTYGNGTARDFRDAFVFAVPPGAYKSDPSVKWMMAMAADWIPPKDSPAWEAVLAHPSSSHGELTPNAIQRVCHHAHLRCSQAIRARLPPPPPTHTYIHSDTHFTTTTTTHPPTTTTTTARCSSQAHQHLRHLVRGQKGCLGTAHQCPRRASFRRA